MIMSKDDLLIDKSKYDELLKIVEFKVLDSEENLEASFENIRKAVLSASAAAQKKSECSNPFTKSVIHNLGPLYYMINSKKGESHA